MGHETIKGIDFHKGLKKIIWLQTSKLGKYYIEYAYKLASREIKEKKQERQKNWEALIPLFKLGCVFEKLDYRFFLLAHRIFSVNKKLCDEACNNLFNFHKFGSREKDFELFGKAAFYAWRKKDEAAKRVFLTKGGEIAEKTFERHVKLQEQFMQIVRLGGILFCEIS